MFYRLILGPFEGRADGFAVKDRVKDNILHAVCCRNLNGLGGRGEARGNRHRKARAKDAVLDEGFVLIFDLDSDGFMWADIGDRGGEDIGPLLFDKAGFLALGFGGLINFLGRLFFFNLAFN